MTMKFETIKQLRDKASYTYGLTNILRCDIDILRKNAADCNLDKIRESIREVDETIKKMQSVVGEIEYILKTENIERP